MILVKEINENKVTWINLNMAKRHENKVKRNMSVL